MPEHLIIRVTGVVQGVFFRGAAREKADALGISGFVRNEDDGSVYMEAEGDPARLDEFVAWCGRGPDFARVERVEVHGGEPKHFNGFSVL